MTKPTREIFACAECGSEKVRVIETIAVTAIYFVRCLECGHESPAKGDGRAAIIEWNAEPRGGAPAGDEKPPVPDSEIKRQVVEVRLRSLIDFAHRIYVSKAADLSTADLNRICEIMHDYHDAMKALHELKWELHPRPSTPHDAEVRERIDRVGIDV